jgi:arginine decarboxylase-like protein
VAFVLNFADYCLKDGREYRTVVAEQFEKCAKRQVKAPAILNKLGRLVTAHSKLGVTTSCAKFIENGTRHLNVRSLSSGIFDEMVKQRKEWGLDELETEHKTKHSTTQDGFIAAEIPSSSVSHDQKRTDRANSCRPRIH